MKVVPADEFKKNASRILDELEATGVPVTITKSVEGPSKATTAEAWPSLFGLLKSEQYSFPDPFSPLDDGWEEAFLQKWDRKLL